MMRCMRYWGQGASVFTGEIRPVPAVYSEGCVAPEVYREAQSSVSAVRPMLDEGKPSAMAYYLLRQALGSCHESLLSIL